MTFIWPKLSKGCHWLKAFLLHNYRYHRGIPVHACVDILKICNSKFIAWPSCTIFRFFLNAKKRHLCCLTGSALDHRSLPPEFESQCGNIWRVFHLWLCFITFGAHSAHLAYHKSGCKTWIIIIKYKKSCDMSYFPDNVPKGSYS